MLLAGGVLRSAGARVWYTIWMVREGDLLKYGVLRLGLGGLVSRPTVGVGGAIVVRSRMAESFGMLKGFFSQKFGVSFRGPNTMDFSVLGCVYGTTKI